MEQLRAYIEASRERWLGELQDICRLPSVVGQEEDLLNTAQAVRARLEQLGASTRLLETNGGPPVVFAEVGEGETSLLSYSHYDVQPPDPLELWESPPFEPQVRDGKLFARGVADDKGDLMARIHAIEAVRAVYGALPLRFMFFVEGEEEKGSPNLEAVAKAHADLLRADGCLWEAADRDPEGRLNMYLGLKGLQYVDMHVRGLARDMHSAFAGLYASPVWRLVQALNTLKDADDRITVDGLMDHVRPPTEEELAYLRRVPLDGSGLKAQAGVPHFINDMDDFDALVRFVYEPTCNICGIYAGWTGEGAKTILPAEAHAKIDFRLVPDLTPELVLDLLHAHLERRGYGDFELEAQHPLPASRSPMDAPVVQTAIAVARDVYGLDPAVYPNHGGSGPMYALCDGLGMAGVTAGVAYYGSNMHAPNENIRLDDYFSGVLFVAELVRRFARFCQLAAG